MSKIFQSITIFVLLFFAFCLRFQVISFGLPDGSNVYHKVPYFSDEIAVVEDFKKLIVFFHTREISYLANWSYMIFGRLLSIVPYYFQVLLDKSFILKQAPQVIEVLKIKQITLAGRFVSLISSFFSLIIFYKILKIFKVKFLISFLIISFLAFNPVDIIMSLQAKANALMNLFISLSLYFSFLYLRKNKKNKIKYLIYAGISSGLAMASRINGGLSVLIPLTAFLLNNKLVNNRLEIKKVYQKIKDFVLILIAFLLAFIISTPTIILEPSLVFKIWQQAGSGRLTMNVNWQLWLSNLRYIVGGELGLIIFFLTLILSCFFVRKMSKEEKLALFWLALYLVVSLFTAVPVLRYLFPILTAYTLAFIIIGKKLFKLAKKNI